MNAMRALLDTNVLIDILTGRPPEAEDAARLVVMQAMGDIELWISAKSFTDAFYIMNRDGNNESAAIQQAFVKSFEFLNVCAVDGNDIRATAERSWPDFEDCLIDVCSEKIKADYLLTRDKDGFKRSRTTVMKPKELFLYLEEQFGLTYEIFEW